MNYLFFRLKACFAFFKSKKQCLNLNFNTLKKKMDILKIENKAYSTMGLP